MKKIFLVLSVICVIAWLGIRITNAQAATKNANEIKEQIEMETSDETFEEVSIEDEILDVDTTSIVEEDVVEYYGSLFQEGEDFGLISYLGQDSKVVVGNTSDSLSHTAMLSPYSTKESKVILGHSYKDGSIFGKLYLLKQGDIVTITEMDGSETSYVVDKIDWVSQDYYNSEEGIEELFDDSYALKMVTCSTKEGVKGRLIVSLNCL